jgi:ArsR family transcriptional regulator
VVSAERTGNAVHYQVWHPMVAELLRIARAFLADTLAASREQLDALDSLPPLDITR